MDQNQDHFTTANFPGGEEVIGWLEGVSGPEEVDGWLGFGEDWFGAGGWVGAPCGCRGS